MNIVTRRVNIRLQGKNINVVYGCLNPDTIISFQKLVQWLKENSRDETLLILTNGCCKIPAWEVIKTALLYSLNGYFSGKMISRTLVHEVLLYLVGDRNIKDVRNFFESGDCKSIGYIGLSIDDKGKISALLDGFKVKFGLKEVELDEKCWIPEYSAYLRVPAEKEILVKTIRARSALLKLSV